MTEIQKKKYHTIFEESNEPQIIELDKRKHYNAFKEYNGQKYTGMKVGGTHNWNYNNGLWNEIKVTPDKWKFEFNSLKSRCHLAPPGTGALNGTEYHWYIIADQKVIKMDENTYNTEMKGSKFKIGYKKPKWKNWSYNYKKYNKESYEDKVIQILESIIENLKARKRKGELFNY
ncbi:MAG: hypothetical protein ACFFD2_05225, partial [Promethearchaeota archaeon]